MNTAIRHKSSLTSSAKIIFLTLWIAVSSLTGCTSNNGDIGPWFGTWVLRSVTSDGQPLESYRNNIFWSFQNEVIRIEVDKSMGNFSEHFGTWKHEDNTLILNYTHSDDSHKPWETVFDFPPGIGFPERGIIMLDILSLNGSEMRLAYRTHDGKLMEYRLKKYF